MPNEQDLPFPFKGIDVTREFQEQPPGTTPDALNVRSRCSIAHRYRGGSAPGFEKRPVGQLQRGTTVFQELGVIVDPTTEAILTAFETPADDWVEHPRFPEVLIPPDGSGNQPNPNVTSFRGGGEIIGLGFAEGEGDDGEAEVFSLSGSLVAGVAGPFSGTYQIDCSGSEEGSLNIDVGQPFTFTFLVAQDDISFNIIENAPNGAIALTVGTGGGSAAADVFSGVDVNGEETGYVFETRNI